MASPLILAFLFVAAMGVTLVEWRWSRSLAKHDAYFAGGEAQGTHLTMNGGMAAMLLWPTAQVFTAVIMLCIAGVIGLAVRLAAFRGAWRARSVATVYHLLALLAMIYALCIMPRMSADMGGMAVMPVSGIARVLAALFLLDGAATLLLGLAMPRLLLRLEGSSPDDARLAGLIRLSSFPHIVMDAGMVLMLLGRA